MSAIEAFRLLLDQELDRYLEDTGYEPGGFKDDLTMVAADDAEWFVAAINSGLVERIPKGAYWLPASRWRTMLFWEGLKEVHPRPLSLFMEGLITVATAARLHLLYGWPKGCLGFESDDGAFDLIGRLPGNRWESLAAEAKSTAAHVRTLAKGVERCAKIGPHPESLHPKGALNAHRKWAGLVRSKAPVMLVFGPGRDWRVFRVEYGPNKSVSLAPADESALAFARFPYRQVTRSGGVP